MSTAQPDSRAAQFKRADARRRSARRLRNLARTGCLPILLIATLIFLIIVNLVPYFQVVVVPLSGPQAVREFIAFRLLVNLELVIMIQWGVSWVIGMVGAVFGTRAAAGHGQFSTHRLLIWQGRLNFLAWAVLAVRLLGLAILSLAVVWSVTPIFGTSLAADWSAQITYATRYELAPFAVLTLVVFMSWIFGPILRLRYSMALGALAATWSRRADERFWLAVSARLGTEMVGVVLAVWGASLVDVMVSAGRGVPNVNLSYPQPPDLISLWPASQGALLVVAAAFIALYMAGQLLLPRLFMRLAAARLSRLPSAEPPPFSQKLAALGVPSVPASNAPPDPSAQLP